jgi:hypothetical protein
VDSKNAILEQIDDVLAATTRRDAAGGFNTPGAEARAFATIERLGAGTPYTKSAGAALRIHSTKVLHALRGILQSLRDDIEAGYLTTIAELIHADVFADFLGMADELSRKGYKDPAAVVAGSVLDEHVRKLAQRNEIVIEDEDGKPLKADRINAELARAEVYNKLEQKNVTAWLDLRNKAAHGEYDEYDHKQVAALISSVRDFLIRHPA